MFAPQKDGHLQQASAPDGSETHRSAAHRGATRTGRRPLSIGIILIDGFAMNQFGLFTDVLRFAADEGDHSRPLDVQWFVMSPTAAPTMASCGVAVLPTSKMLDPKELDYVVIIGGLVKPALRVGDEVLDYLRCAAAAGVSLVGLCSAGTMVLYRAGLMQGRRCCVGWYHYQDFLDHFPGEEVVADRLFLVDNDRVTCAGAAASADLAIHLISQRVGQAKAQKASHFLCVDRARAGHEVQPHAPIAATVREPRVRRALLLMEQHLTRPLAMAVLARKLKVSLRQLERLFEDELGSSPVALYRSVRMRHAAWLLSHTQQSVTDIALNSGFADCAHFSREFRRAYGSAPTQHRIARSASPMGELAATRIFE
jgi:transcriptional regulator GlxA family with amidase domain